MLPEIIGKFVEQKKLTGIAVNIHFKERSTITGLFIKSGDYKELKLKNFWRVVSSVNLEEYQQTKNESLARIFNGSSFTRLSEHTIR